MEIHYLDIIGWFVMILIVYFIFLPEDAREELGFALLGLPVLIVCSLFISAREIRG